MAGVAHRPIAIAIAFASLAFAVLAGHAGSAGAAEADPAPAATMTQEWVGLELTPMSVSFPGTPCCGRQGHVDTFQAGPGGGVRLFRHRWQNYYFTPILAGVYVTSENRTIFAHVETEGGLIVPRTDRRLELGIGFGLAGLAVKYATGCDGSCDVGGAGSMVSFAARYLFVDRPTFSIGAGARAVLPLQSNGEWFGYFVADGKMILGSVEVAFGRG